MLFFSYSFSCRDAATRLVNQLYERESRRSYCPPQFWIFKEIKYEAFFNVNLDDETAAKLRVCIQNYSDFSSLIEMLENDTYSAVEL
jgi:hypothetical protein